MSVFTKTAVDIFAAQDASGAARKVANHDVQVWGTEVERAIKSFQAGGGVVFDSKTEADGSLDYNAYTMAWVFDVDPDKAGIYQKQGASGSGSWQRVGDLPYSFILATNTNSGNPNAIEATTAIPIPAADGGALIALPIVADNTASPVTVSFNGGSALTIKTIAGNDVPASALASGMTVWGFKSGDEFRLVTDLSSAAILAGAQAAAEAAENAASRAQSYSAMLSADKVKFNTVAALLADETMSYTSGAGLIEVGPGDIIEAEGFRYEVAASDATDEHVETAGGVKLRVLASDMGEYNMAAWGLTESTAAADTAALFESVIPSLPSGATLRIPAGSYACDPVAATVGGDLVINGSMAFLATTNQPSNGDPLFMLTGSGVETLVVDGLNTIGTRPDEDTTVPENTPDGLQVDNFAEVIVRNSIVRNHYHTGIRAVRVGVFKAYGNNVSQMGYGGILWHSTGEADVFNNHVSDIGCLFDSHGYGLSAAATFPSRDGGPNVLSRIHSNKVYRCKRRSLDVHCGLVNEIYDNYVEGFGRYAIRVVGEGQYKEVRHGHVHGNTILFDPSFNTTSYGGVEYGSFGAASEVTDIVAHGNKFSSLGGGGDIAQSAYQLHGTQASSPERGGDRFVIYGDKWDNISSYMFANLETGNVREAVLSDIQYSGEIRNRIVNFGASGSAFSFKSNDFGTFLGGSGSIGVGANWEAVNWTQNTINGVLAGQQERGADGSFQLNRTASFGASTSDINLCAVEVTGTDASAAIAVEVVVSRNTGVIRYKGIAYMTRSGDGTPSYGVGTMTTDVTGTGTLNAPSLQWYDTNKLRLVPNNSFAGYMIKVEAVAFRSSIYGLGIS